MARTPDRLATVLRVRRVQEQVAAGRLATAEAHRRRAEGALAERREDVAVPRTDRHVVELSWAAVDRAATAASVAVATADGERTTWSDAARRVKGLERLDGRLRDEARLDERRRQAGILDDLVTTRVARRSAS
jgi:flagellar FliJ protein